MSKSLFDLLLSLNLYNTAELAGENSDLLLEKRFLFMVVGSWWISMTTNNIFICRWVRGKHWICPQLPLFLLIQPHPTFLTNPPHPRLTFGKRSCLVNPLSSLSPMFHISEFTTAMESNASGSYSWDPGASTKYSVNQASLSFHLLYYFLFYVPQYSPLPLSRFSFIDDKEWETPLLFRPSVAM